MIYLLDPKHPLFETRFFGEFPTHFSCWGRYYWMISHLWSFCSRFIVVQCKNCSFMCIQCWSDTEGTTIAWGWRNTSCLVVFLVFVGFFLLKTQDFHKKDVAVRPSFLNVTLLGYFYFFQPYSSWGWSSLMVYKQPTQKRLIWPSLTHRKTTKVFFRPKNGWLHDEGCAPLFRQNFVERKKKKTISARWDTDPDIKWGEIKPP